MLNLADYRLNATHGFLPTTSNATTTATNAAWHELALRLPKLLPAGQVKQAVLALPSWQAVTNAPEEELELHMRALSYIGHAYLWGEPGALPHTLPAKLAYAWVSAADAVGRPAILSYPSYCLYNYRKVDEALPAHLGNIEIIQNFFGGADEDWFILIHVDIEARAGQAVAAVPGLLTAATAKDASACLAGLNEIEASLKGINTTMNRMPELCDPYIYYTRVRPYIFGTKNNPDLPNGLVYEGQYNDKPQFFRGETGAQSGIVPMLDALLGVYHENDPLKEYLLEMRSYMPPAHRKFVEDVEAHSQLRSFIAHAGNGELLAAYNRVINELFAFRAKHLEYAASYIHKQAQQANNSNVVGTGGTPFMTYLAKHRDETKLSLAKPA